jgi:hypothetical protein
MLMDRVHPRLGFEVVNAERGVQYVSFHNIRNCYKPTNYQWIFTIAPDLRSVNLPL